MILQLTKGTIKIKAMVVPEPLDAVYIQYIFETGTNHLKPRMTITAKNTAPRIYTGDRMFIDMKEGFTTKDLQIRVDLLTADGAVVRSYGCEVPYMEYCVIGPRPVRPDLEAYIRQLESRVAELEEQGEVI